VSFTTILLVSADPDDQHRVSSALASLRGSPYQLEHAATLADGLACIRSRVCDAILLAPNLPDSGGLTTFLRLQTKANDIPIIVLIDELGDETGREAVARGALDQLERNALTGQLLDRTLRYATERTHTLLALKASEQRYRELFQNVTAGVFQTTPEGRFVAANPALVRMLGYESEDELLELDIARDLYLEPVKRAAWLRALTEKDEVHNFELVLKCRDGSKLVVLENSRAVRDDEGSVIFFEGTLTDITSTHELSQQLSHDASHDALTGLCNRREFELRLQLALEMCQATAATHAVCYIDLDRFKIVNDRCGHVAGDELLRQFGALLQQEVRHADVVARLGGDEFAVLLHNCESSHAMQVANSLLEAVQRFEFIWGKHRFTVGASIGVVTVDQSFRRIAQVMNAADAACYAAKDSGRDRVHLYHEAEEAVAQRRGELDWVARAKRALAENLLFLDAQPILPLGGANSEPIHYELLLRMRDEAGRVVPPGAFLPVIERYNLAVRYDRWVIVAAIKWLRSQPDVVGRIGRLFINLSRDSLDDPGTAMFIREVAANAGIDPARLGFETTEGIAISNLSKANHLINELRRIGCSFALDDFGSGVSSFAYLKALNTDYLKIDGMLMGNLAQDHVDQAMVRSIADIGHVMGKKVIAEGVETTAVLESLRALGVDFAQGYAVGEPRPLEEIGQISVSDLLG